MLEGMSVVRAGCTIYEESGHKDVEAVESLASVPPTNLGHLGWEGEAVTP